MKKLKKGKILTTRERGRSNLFNDRRAHAPVTSKEMAVTAIIFISIAATAAYFLFKEWAIQAGL